MCRLLHKLSSADSTSSATPNRSSARSMVTYIPFCVFTACEPFRNGHKTYRRVTETMFPTPSLFLFVHTVYDLRTSRTTDFSDSARRFRPAGICRHCVSYLNKAARKVRADEQMTQCRLLRRLQRKRDCRLRPHTATQSIVCSLCTVT